WSMGSRTAKSPLPRERKAPRKRLTSGMASSDALELVAMDKHRRCRARSGYVRNGESKLTSNASAKLRREGNQGMGSDSLIGLKARSVSSYRVWAGNRDGLVQNSHILMAVSGARTHYPLNDDTELTAYRLTRRRAEPVLCATWPLLLGLSWLRSA